MCANTRNHSSTLQSACKSYTGQKTTAQHLMSAAGTVILTSIHEASKSCLLLCTKKTTNAKHLQLSSLREQNKTNAQHVQQGKLQQSLAKEPHQGLRQNSQKIEIRTRLEEWQRRESRRGCWEYSLQRGRAFECMKRIRVARMHVCMCDCM